MSGYWLPEAVGDLATLTANLEEAVGIADKIGDSVLRGYALTFLGLVTWGRGQLAQAEAMLQEALAIHERADSLHMRVLNRKGIGFVRVCRQDWAGAAEVLERGLAEADAVGLRVHGVQMSRLTLAYAYRMQGRLVSSQG